MPGKIGSREEWLAARKALLEKEKEYTHQGDVLAAERRELPIVKIDKEYLFQGPGNKTVSLSDLFDGQEQLIVYHFMFDPKDDRGCPGCTHMGESLPDVRHLKSKDTNLVAISRAPIEKIEAYKKKAGWTFPWYSNGNSDFNYDFHATLDESVAPKQYNFEELKEEDPRFKPSFKGDIPGFSVFLKKDGNVYHTYSTYMRGGEKVQPTLTLLDMTPLGRRLVSPGDFKLRDEYGTWGEKNGLFGEKEERRRLSNKE